MNNDVKKVLFSMMEACIDKEMEIHGFKRRKNSFVYSRKKGTTKQKIEMISFSHPAYHPGALVHIYPWMAIYFPDINETAVKLVDKNLIDIEDDLTIRQPIQIYTDSERWILMGEEDAEKTAERIGKFIKEYTIPLIDSLNSIDDFIKMYEINDKRIIMDEKVHLYIVSAYIVKRDYLNAQKAMELRFGKLGLRKRYASVFEYLKNVIQCEEDL